jgi:hypothetical protein
LGACFRARRLLIKSQDEKCSPLKANVRLIEQLSRRLSQQAPEKSTTWEFDLPIELLFKAYEEPEIFEQWLGTKVLKLESKKHGKITYYDKE